MAHVHLFDGVEVGVAGAVQLLLLRQGDKRVLLLRFQTGKRCVVPVRGESVGGNGALQRRYRRGAENGRDPTKCLAPVDL